MYRDAVAVADAKRFGLPLSGRRPGGAGDPEAQRTTLYEIAEA